MQEQQTKKFTRKGQQYTAYYEDEKLVRLINETSGQVIPPTTQSFRRLADDNRGNKFEVA